jgi:putative transposase
MKKNKIIYKSNKNIVYSCKYHVIFCPKYRRKVLINGVDTRLKTIITMEIIKQYIEGQKHV